MLMCLDTVARIQRVYDELVHYVTECEFEQYERLAGRIPTLDEYIENRLGTAAVYVLCAFNECVSVQS
jgi:hypothetical protein